MPPAPDREGRRGAMEIGAGWVFIGFRLETGS
jgi:hypothetical protein